MKDIINRNIVYEGLIFTNHSFSFGTYSGRVLSKKYSCRQKIHQRSEWNKCKTGLALSDSCRIFGRMRSFHGWVS